ncbi:MmoB/DmpM family protein [Sinimarinibacterium flocculans]|uniref:MmoB/DmpM family protein n=1 Tax=Sinimarinibacterium flocculans TaxID=985250 RepID=UPI0024917E02|nr:MmoB/DmpM family protein [Sinimarinibacterium flocculans]
MSDVTSAIWKESHKVTAKLINGADAEAIAAVMSAAHPDLVVKDFGSYLALERERELIFRLADIAEELGHKFEVPDFLTVLASYTGQVDVQDDTVSITEFAA